MSLQYTIQSRMIDAVKSRDEAARNAYRFLKGKLDNVHQQPVSDEVVIAMVKTFLEDAKTTPGSFSETEVRIMKEMVPPTLSEAATKQYLVESDVVTQIKDCPREGQAIGIAMKTFAKGKRCVDSATVRSVVTALRSVS